jgi:UPF0716 protein FxsA
MRSAKMIAFGLLMLPAAEIAAFIIVASLIGTPAALGLLVLASLCGFLVLRRLGTGAVTRLRASATSGGVTGLTLDGGGVATALGGILLVIPGFITGILGLAMILPASRRWMSVLAKRFVPAARRPPGPEIVDLAPEEWQHLPDPQLRPPRRRRPP